MIKKITSKPILLLSAILLIIGIVSGITYAYFDSIYTGNEKYGSFKLNAKYSKLVLAGVISIEFINSSLNTASNFYFTVKNTGTQETSYKLFLNDIIHTIERTDYVTYTLTCTSDIGTCTGNSKNIFPTKDSLALIQSTITSGETQTYSLNIVYIDPTNTTSLLNKSINFNVVIDPIENNFANLILENEGGKRAIITKGKPDIMYYTSADDGMYVTTDQDGFTYYYHGNVKSNYVSFAGLTWRIIRINGNGTIRLILNEYAKDTSGNNYSVRYNSASECSADLATLDSIAECVRYGTGLYSDGSIANYVNEWFINNITGDNLNYIQQNETFCNDYSYEYIALNNTFGPGIRRNERRPILTCTAPSDFVNGEAKELYMPVGLITFDELALASASNTTDSSYLFDSSLGWTMSPSNFSSSGVGGFIIASKANISFNLSVPVGFRPVINLQANVDVTGSGTESDPYVIGGFNANLKTKVIDSGGGTTYIESKNDLNFYNTITTSDGIYATLDQDGKTYYYRGSVSNNYLSMGGMLWRIVRANGDGSIRLVLNDYAKDTNGNNYLVAYNSNSNCANSDDYLDTAIECAKYGEGNYASNSIASKVNDWYSNNITSDLEKYIKQDGKFCNDTSANVLGGIGYYTFGSGYRIYDGDEIIPDLTCIASDEFGMGSAKTLKLPVGLLTGDELVLAGSRMNNPNSSFYLYNGNTNWWTMSALSYTSNDKWDLKMIGSGSSSALGINVEDTIAFRPVINIYGSLNVIGSGTQDDPYTIIDN